MKTIRQHTAVILALIAGILFSPGWAHAQCKYPANSAPFEITGFRTVMAGANLVRFIPLCGTGDCPAGDLAGFSYLWNFGDGTYSFSSTPEKTYTAKSPASGYEVALRVSNIYEDPEFAAEAGPAQVASCDLPKARVMIAADSIPGRYDQEVALTSHQPVAKRGFPLQYKVDFMNNKRAGVYFHGEFVPDPRLSLSLNGRSLGFEYDSSVFTSVTVVKSGTQDVVKFSGKVADRKTVSIVINSLLDQNADPATPVVSQVSMNYGSSPDGKGSSGEARASAPIGHNWDPNEMDAVPVKYVIAGEWIEYTINFENEGNAGVERVMIIDPLPFEVDITTFRMVNCSHPDEMRDPLIMGNTILWEMPTLNLPGFDPHPPGPRSGKEKNTPKNIGFITFRVQVKKGLNIDQTIANQAWIIFDAAVAQGTNTYVNRIPRSVDQLNDETGTKAVGITNDK